jgi:hypothetical protein
MKNAGKGDDNTNLVVPWHINEDNRFAAAPLPLLGYSTRIGMLTTNQTKFPEVTFRVLASSDA